MRKTVEENPTRTLEQHKKLHNLKRVKVRLNYSYRRLTRFNKIELTHHNSNRHISDLVNSFHRLDKFLFEELSLCLWLLEPLEGNTIQSEGSLGWSSILMSEILDLQYDLIFCLEISQTLIKDDNVTQEDLIQELKSLYIYNFKIRLKDLILKTNKAIKEEKLNETL